MDLEYMWIVDILTVSSIKVANMDIIYWSVCSSSRRGGDKGGGGYSYFSQIQVSLYYGLVKDPCTFIEF